MTAADDTKASGPDAFVLKKDVKKKDFTDDFQAVIPIATDVARKGNLGEGLEQLLNLEKRARLGGDTKIVSETALVIVKLCFELKKWDELNANVTLLCKRRGQFKKVQITVIQEGTERVASVTPKEEKLRLIKTLRAVSEGKIYVEAERARLTMQLAKIYEAEGKISEAADVLQEEQVETYGAMNKQEKIDFLLEQIRLCLEKKDFIRAYIIAKKVNRKQLEEEELETLKIRFYRLLIQYHTHEKQPLELARAHLAIYTSLKKQDASVWIPELQLTVLLLCTSSFDNHQIDLVHNLLLDEKLEEVPLYKTLLRHFVTDELAQWPLPENDEIVKNPLFKNKDDWYFKMLRDRVVQHDIRVVAKYYTKIRAARLAHLLQMDIDEAEKYIADMVTSTTSERLIAKIDRPAGIISFEPKKDANAHLSDWAGNISELLGLVEKTCHLIHKENMVHQAKK
uniref:PCI domain-containing protein n=1 Tax=Mucochytrium quahogii TaxID=96639 RepID=A0A7S2RMQ9_9STRA|mmetsp:Transcript_1227/g.1471  ORF Transcript_1227/g.1471 Transcript_1227/m.1471 type:complete len:454 (-) Transcript_1227:1310-2671(-)